eukprot:gene8474-biopygen22624
MLFLESTEGGHFVTEDALQLAEGWLACADGGGVGQPAQLAADRALLQQRLQKDPGKYLDSRHTQGVWEWNFVNYPKQFEYPRQHLRDSMRRNVAMSLRS